jgi:UDP-N-acetylmuramoylalanine--D-glutamate ligase
MEPGDLVVQELSSFQLEIWRCSPPIAAVLNITPNHLDRHKSMSAYSSAKANILRYQDVNDTAVLYADDPGAMALAPSVRGRLRLFSIQHEVDDGAFVREGNVWLRNKSREEIAVCSLETVRLRGKHNLLNVCAAATLADSVDIPVGAMVEAIRSFDGVEHRLEIVATVNGVQYVNDSIATAPERALAAIESFDEPLILLAGGKDKDMVWDRWAECVNERAKHVFLFGDLAEMLSERLTIARPTDKRKAGRSQASTLAQAVEMAAEIAEPGDVVLLAPGGTSFDSYIDFAARGDHFRELVKGIVEAHS